MLIYIFLLLFLFVLAFSKNKRFLFISFPILLFVCGFRSADVGTDTYNYYSYFSSIGGDSVFRMEFLWTKLNELVYNIGGSFQLVLLLSAFLTLFPVYFVVYKISKSPNLSILILYLLWYYFYGFNIIRQSVACSIILLAAYYFFNRKYLKTILSLGIASLFHTIAIIVIPAFLFLYYYPTFRRKRTYLVYIGISLLIGLILGPRILEFVTTFSDAFTNYNHYVEDLAIGFSEILIFLVLYDVLFLIILWLLRTREEWFQMYFLSIIVMNMVILFPYGERIAPLLGMAQLLVFPNFINNNRIKQGITIGAIFILMYCFLGFALKFKSNVAGIIPYELTFMSLFRNY